MMNTPQQSPLALCSSESLDYERDVVTFEVRYAQRIGENWFGRAGENAKRKHEWSYWSDMEFEEALLFKQWDRFELKWLHYFRVFEYTVH